MARAKSWEEYKAECEAVAKEGITILGFVEPWKGNQTKLICSCQKHGKWKTTAINGFKRGASCISCGWETTGKKLAKTWDECKIECERAAKKGIKILGFVGHWQGVKTKLICECELHGKWESTSIECFQRGNSCIHCSKDNKGNTKEDEEHIKEFFNTNAFHPDAKFFRADKAGYWLYSCPICSRDTSAEKGFCSGTFQVYGGSLKKGILPCRCNKRYRLNFAEWVAKLEEECSKRNYTFIEWSNSNFGFDRKFKYSCPAHGIQQVIVNDFLQGKGCPQCAGRNQQECYVNFVYDEKIPVALKFGIANNSETRLKVQNKGNLFQMEMTSIYEFRTVRDCKAAEQACLRELECGILTARELKDGWTETTSIQNMDKIIEIYERFGGVRIK